MPKLPKSVVIEGRRYPTWALSSRARDQLMNLHQVDAHIAELRQRLAFYTAAHRRTKAYLRRMLPDEMAPVSKEVAKKAPAEMHRYFWHIVPLAWGKENLPTHEAVLKLHSIGASDLYQEGDRLLLYVKGHGVVGWGTVEVDAPSAQQHLALCFEVASLDEALPASALKEFSLRHPNRVSQLLPATADVERLLAALESLPAA